MSVCDCKQNLVPCQNKDTERGLYLLEGRNTAYDTESPRETDFWNEVPSNLILIKTKWNLWYLISPPLYYLGAIVKDSAEIEEETGAALRSFQSDSGRSKHWTAQERKQSPWQWINTFVFSQRSFSAKVRWHREWRTCLYCCGTGENRIQNGRGECRGGWRVEEGPSRKEKGWISKTVQRCKWPLSPLRA